eukprot:NODE_387_length_8274_cov_0.737125.p4 type:complete len:209 gc:universal NODE_387_length_8274_cov_0.737125:3321-2695(-)
MLILIRELSLRNLLRFYCQTELENKILPHCFIMDTVETEKNIIFENTQQDHQPDIESTKHNESESTRNNIDELDIESISITDDEQKSEGKRSSVVIHDEIDTDQEPPIEINAESLDDLECEPVSMIDLESEDNQVVVTASDTEKNNSYRTDTTVDDETETPKASIFQMTVFLVYIEKLSTNNSYRFWVRKRKAGTSWHLSQTCRLRRR